MADIYNPKPGDRFFHPRRVKRFRLRRVLGVPAVFLHCPPVEVLDVAELLPLVAALARALVEQA